MTARISLQRTSGKDELHETNRTLFEFINCEFVNVSTETGASFHSEKMPFECRDLDRTKFPLRRNVMEYFMFLRAKDIQSCASRHTAFLDFDTRVCREIRALWSAKDIPVVSNATILANLKEIVTGYKKVKKRPQSINAQYWDELLIISRCKCRIELGNDCTCEDEKKIPLHAKRFYIDQCGPRRCSLENN